MSGGNFCCPICGAWSDMLSSRNKDSMGKVLPYRRRAYTCGNNHNFTTYEFSAELIRGTDVAKLLTIRVKGHKNGDSADNGTNTNATDTPAQASEG